MCNIFPYKQCYIEGRREERKGRKDGGRKGKKEGKEGGSTWQEFWKEVYMSVQRLYCNKTHIKVENSKEEKKS